jgi:hypothetical protein
MEWAYTIGVALVAILLAFFVDSYTGISGLL